MKDNIGKFIKQYCINPKERRMWSNANAYTFRQLAEDVLVGVPLGDVYAQWSQCIAIGGRKRYRFHDNPPDFIMPFWKLSRRTRQNIEKLTKRYGMKFETQVYVWLVFQLRRGLLTDFESGEEYYRVAKDILVLGKFQNKPVEYWRHETRNPAAGQTLIYIAGVCFRVSKLFEDYATEEELSWEV